MFQHYDEGDRIITNEPCLNCTCQDAMLMCFLKVCPFTKPIGQDCTIEKRPDQCCPIITCPEGRPTASFNPNSFDTFGDSAKFNHFRTIRLGKLKFIL